MMRARLRTAQQSMRSGQWVGWCIDRGDEVCMALEPLHDSHTYLSRAVPRRQTILMEPMSSEPVGLLVAVSP